MPFSFERNSCFLDSGIGQVIKSFYSHYVAHPSQQIKTVFNMNAEHGQVGILFLLFKKKTVNHLPRKWHVTSFTKSLEVSGSCEFFTNVRTFYFPSFYLADIRANYFSVETVCKRLVP